MPGRSHRIQAKPLTASAFAPFGQMVEAPQNPGRQRSSEALSHDDRPAVLSTSTVEPDDSPITIHQLERHPHSSQTFLPLSVSRWLVVVSTTLNPSDVRCFMVGPGTGVTIGRGIWHHRLTALDGVGRFAVLMWKDGLDDDEFRDIETIEVHVGLQPSTGAH